MLPRATRLRILAASAVSAVLASSVVLSASATDGQPPRSAPAESSTLELALPAVSPELRKFADDINLKYRDDPNYSTIRILDDRTGIEIYWDGSPPAELREKIASAPEGYSVRVEPTANNPGVMRRESQRLLESGVASSAGFGPSAETIEITIPDRVSTSKARSLAKSIVADVPVAVVEGTVEPTDRFSDTEGSGGVKIELGDTSRCTSGFSVYTHEPSYREAAITAGHCGLIGENVESLTNHVSWGNVNDRTVTHDGLVMNGVPGGGLPAVWFGDVLTTDYRVYTVGSTHPLVGDEICVSGAVSGSSCGHIVEQVDISWNYAADGRIPAMSGIQGYLTQQINNHLYVGPGDSGGPGIIQFSSSDNYAVTMISGIRDGIRGYCDGGDYGPSQYWDDDRKCSDQVLHVSAVDSANAMGWQIKLGWPGSG